MILPWKIFIGEKIVTASPGLPNVLSGLWLSCEQLNYFSPRTNIAKQWKMKKITRDISWEITEVITCTPKDKSDIIDLLLDQ